MQDFYISMGKGIYLSFFPPEKNEAIKASSGTKLDVAPPSKIISNLLAVLTQNNFENDLRLST